MDLIETKVQVKSPLKSGGETTNSVKAFDTGKGLSITQAVVSREPFKVSDIKWTISHTSSGLALWASQCKEYKPLGPSKGTNMQEIKAVLKELLNESIDWTMNDKDLMTYIKAEGVDLVKVRNNIYAKLFLRKGTEQPVMAEPLFGFGTQNLGV